MGDYSEEYHLISAMERDSKASHIDSVALYGRFRVIVHTHLKKWWYHHNMRLRISIRDFGLPLLP